MIIIRRTLFCGNSSGHSTETALKYCVLNNDTVQKD